MLLGIVLHGGLSFLPGMWLVQDQSQSLLLGLPFAAIHGFRMGLFFLVSGFFTAMLWRRRGLRALLLHRFRRIFLPLLLGLVTIIPATNLAGWFALKNSPSPISQATESAPTEREKIRNVLESQGLLKPVEERERKDSRLHFFLHEFPLFHHLWFLWYLCWMVIGFALLAPLLERFTSNPEKLGLIRSPLALLVMIPLTAVPQAFMGHTQNHFGPDTSISLVPPFYIPAYYALFFAFGVLYFQSNDGKGTLSWPWRSLMAVSLVLVFPLALEFTNHPFGFAGQLLPEGMHKIAACLLQAGFAWMMCLGLMGAFREKMDQHNPAIRYVSDASYWLYLVHIPVVIPLQWLIRDWPLPLVIKLPLLLVSLTALLLLSYHLLVRRTWIGRLLNGIRKAG